MFWVKKDSQNKCQKLIFPKKEKTLISKFIIDFKTLIFIIDDPFVSHYCGAYWSILDKVELSDRRAESRFRLGDEYQSPMQ